MQGRACLSLQIFAELMNQNEPNIFRTTSTQIYVPGWLTRNLILL